MKITNQRRRHLRRNTSSRGLVILGKDNTLKVTIGDLSVLGARLLFDVPEDMPVKFHFIDLDTGKAHESEIVWRTATELGLFIVRSVVLDGTTPRDLGFLRTIWIEKA